jgi:hypothetical protein
MNEQPFPCHLTHEEDVDFDDARELPLCSGALAYMKKNGKSPRNPELNKLVKEVSEDVLENILDIGEFFSHHKKADKSNS